MPLPLLRAHEFKGSIISFDKTRKVNVKMVVHLYKPKLFLI